MAGKSSIESGERSARVAPIAERLPVSVGKATRVASLDGASAPVAHGERGDVAVRVSKLRERLADAPLVQMSSVAAQRFHASYVRLKRELAPNALRGLEVAPPAFAASLAPMPLPPTGMPPTGLPPTSIPAPAAAAEGEVIFDVTVAEEAGLATAEAGALTGLLGFLIAAAAVALVVVLVVEIIEILEQNAEPRPHRLTPKGRDKGKGGDRGTDVSPSRPGRPDDDDERRLHRGRLQVQGDDMHSHAGGELSYAWTQPSPMTKAVGVAELAALAAQLSKSQRRVRKDALADAEHFILTTTATTPPEVRRSFRDEAMRRSSRRTEHTYRVDIEILSGTAFV